MEDGADGEAVVDLEGEDRFEPFEGEVPARDKIVETFVFFVKVKWLGRVRLTPVGWPPYTIFCCEHVPLPRTLSENAKTKYINFCKYRHPKVLEEEPGSCKLLDSLFEDDTPPPISTPLGALPATPLDEAASLGAAEAKEVVPPQEVVPPVEEPPQSVPQDEVEDIMLVTL